MNNKTETLHVRLDTLTKRQLEAMVIDLGFDDTSSLIRHLLKKWIGARTSLENFSESYKSIISSKFLTEKTRVKKQNLPGCKNRKE